MRLREEGECKALRLKCALSNDMKARMEDHRGRLALKDREREMERLRAKDREERQKSKKREEKRALEAVRRELQEGIKIEKAWQTLVGYSVGG